MTTIVQRPVGRTDLRISEFGLGGAPLGNLYAPLAEQAATAVLNAAWDAGIRYFDTAPFYGFGLSERRFGDRLRGEGRDGFLLSSKVGRLLRPLPGYSGISDRHCYHSPMPFELVYDYSYDGVMRSFEDSLQRLGLARIDILLMHDLGAMTHGDQHEHHFRAAIEDGYRALDELRSAGLIGAIGLGVNECEVCEAVLDHGDFDVFLLAGRYTLLEQGALDNLLPKCEQRGISLIIGGPYNSGILARGTRGNEPLYYNYAPAPADIIDRVRRIEDLCQDHGVPMAAAALQFPLQHPQVATVVPGVCSEQELAQNLELFNTPLPPSLWRDLQSAGLIRSDAPLREAV